MKRLTAALGIAAILTGAVGTVVCEDNQSAEAAKPGQLPGSVDFPGLDKPIDPGEMRDSGEPSVVTNRDRNQHFVTLTTPAGKTHHAKLFERWHVRKKQGGGYAIDSSFLAEEVTHIPAGSQIDRVIEPQRALDSDFAYQGHLQLPGLKNRVPVIVLLAK